MGHAADAAKKIKKLPMWLPWALIVLGVVGLFGSVGMLKNTPNPPADVTVGAGPSSTRPAQKQIDDHTVAPGMPKYIAIPVIEVPKTRVLGLGLTNGRIISPANIYDAGWYTGSARPGEAGAMFIFGHVSSWQADGIFHDLKKLRPGDRVAVTRGDDRVFTYEVIESTIYPAGAVDMPAVLSPGDGSKPGLNLMTCAGSIIKGTSEFSERLVVFTRLVSTSAD